PTAAASGCASAAATSASSQPGCTTTSLFRNTTYGAPHAATARLYAAPNPTFRSSRTTRAPGATRSAAAAEPSVEPLSTTHSSAHPPSCGTSPASAPPSHAPPFQFSTITATRGATPL